ncbi:MAG: DNA polymerase III subunit alpha, partial [Verrucomicrobiales bacterium]|nr:DNA polymerase III subunit alpha [Verrucomicrobiales bacterium]
GIFQLESSGMRELCRKFNLSSIEHITALVALYRPGPMDLIPEFIRRRHGEVQIEYEHPLLEPIARETYGILIYQEQVMQAAQVLAGYTLGAADLLRRAMGKKKREEMAQQRAVFVRGCWEKNQIPADKANQIFDLLEKFAGYGFNKSHAAAYAIVAYQTAYLKAHYPVEFLCAMMTNDLSDTAKLGQYIAEARGMGIEVLPPDVNESDVYFTPTTVRDASGGPDKPAIRFGLAAIKGVGEAAVETILKARREGGPFRSLQDFCERLDGRTVNRKILEALIKSGACDGFGQTRATLLAQIDRAMARAASIIADRQRGQSSLFGALEDRAEAVPESLSDLPEWPLHERLAHEKELLGFYVTGHPLDPYATLLEQYSLARTGQLAELPNRTLTRIGGLITAVQHGLSRKTGKPWSLLTLEDLEGSVPVLVMNEAYERHREWLQPNRAVLVLGEVNTTEERPKIFAQEILPLEDAPKRFTLQVHLRFQTARLQPDDLDAIRELVAAHPGKCPLFLCFQRADGATVFIQTHDRFYVTPSRELQQAVEARFGRGTYYAKVDRTPPTRPSRWPRRTEAVNGTNGGPPE